MSADIFLDTIQIAGGLSISYGLLMILRAVACRIAGTQAQAVLGMSLLTFNFATPLPRLKVGDYQDESEETDNTETPENTEKHAETPLESPQLMQASGYVSSPTIQRMSDEERDAFETARRNAIILLDRCVMYYRQRPTEKDEGRIPRYNDLGISAKNRGASVNDLWESGFCSKGPEGTFIFPEIASSCAELYSHIVKRDYPKYRVYPYGYARQKKERLDSAVNALPEVKH